VVLVAFVRMASFLFFEDLFAPASNSNTIRLSDGCKTQIVAPMCCHLQVCVNYDHSFISEAMYCAVLVKYLFT
jgi:hypothetical protein